MLEKSNGQTVFAWSTMTSYPTGNDEKDKVFIYNMTLGQALKIDVDENSTGKIGGLEFSTWEDDVIYVSYRSDIPANSGLIKLDYSNPNQILRENITSQDNDYSHTFLQLAPDGNIYGVANDGLSLCQINMGNGMFTPGYFPGEVLSYISTYGQPNYYILPENEQPILGMILTAGGVSCGCDDNNDGSVTVFPRGGVPPYTFAWTDSQGNPMGNTQTITNLPVGNYTCCITDSDSPPYTYCENVQVMLDPGLLSFTFDDNLYDIDNSNVTWSNMNFSFRYGIRVHEGYKLTIDQGSYMEFGEDAKIIVEPGAELVIDNSTLSYFADCPCGWLGIEVWGNPEVHQYQCNGVIQQGKVTIKNGSLIEHAEIAVLLGSRVGSGSSGGGILQIPNNGSMETKSASFLNNRYALYFTPYQNYRFDVNCNNTLPAANLSYIYNALFEVNANYIYGNWGHAHTKLNKVDGIDFHGCTFAQYQNPEPKGKGIDALGSGFSVEEICNSIQKPCPENSVVYSSFTNFNKAIVSANSGVYTALVKNTDFYDNSLGIKLSNVNNATVIMNNFYLGKPAACDLQTTTSFGIDILGSTGFAIEENFFTKANGAPTGNYIGIRVKDCPSTWDIVYLNDFDGLSYGNYAQGTNRETQNNDGTGVEYRCNTNTNNAVDFIVTGAIPIQAMIRTEQGTEDVASGNVFSNPVKWHYRNEGLQFINYWYCNTCPNEEPMSIYMLPGYNTFDKDIAEHPNTCPSHYGGGGTVGTGGRLLLTDTEKLEMEQAYSQNLSNYNNVKALADNLKDGGNTDVLLNEVELSWPNDMWELRSKLLGDSPHLSKEVLMTAADKTDVLPESVLFEILSANPDELKSLN
ncbi:MAG: hypothetical protein GXO89_07830 [Chlorobi bacterium]|nr:hypothetical protein [Chlorobiota bacterium]